MKAIDRVLKVAEAEIGYLEKKSDYYLNDKTENAGSNNYTKYWRDVKVAYQGQPWCAAFVSWVLMRAFDVDIAKDLLMHYPFVYCPTLAYLAKKNGRAYSTPQPGDIVLFYRNGEFTHTGLVKSYSNGIVRTIEGNTSGGSTIIANGGAVCAKSYVLSNLSGTIFYRPPYEKYEAKEVNDMSDAELSKLVESKVNAALAKKDELINTMGKEIQDLYSLHKKQNEEIWWLKCQVADK